MTVAVRSYGDPLELAAEVRAAVSELDPSLAASSVALMEDRVAEAIVSERFATRVFVAFAVAALLLAAVGLYGVVSYGVSRRLREMGIRLALGAAADDVRRMVVRRGLALAVAGATLGAVGAVVLSGVLERLLYQVPVADPATCATTVGVLTAVALVASWWPARRAARTDPASVLRDE
jgi:ABC-type antimicrobial peptide transport system permease subunit